VEFTFFLTAHVLVLFWPSRSTTKFLYLFFHDFKKINDASKICQNYTIAAISHGGGVLHWVKRLVSALNGVPYDA
jgi:hypothetical protein